MKKLTTRKMAAMALLIALVYIFSRFFQIPYVTPFGNTRFHLGNTFCVLAGILMGPLYGGLCAGIGSALYDLFDPIYFTAAPTTFINKFMMGLVAGAIFRSSIKMAKKPKIILSAALGQITYIILYLLKTFIQSYYILGLSMEATLVEIAQKAGVSTINGIISVIVATLLAIPLLKAIKFE